MPRNPKAGALNLLKNCLNVQPDDSVLLVLEPTDSLYDYDVVTIIRGCLSELNTRVTIVDPPLIADPADFPSSVADAMEHCDHTLFLSRIGDYVRFVPLPGTGSRATSYSFNADMLSAPYATVDNHLLRKLQLRLEDELMRADQWRIQCPLGTDLSGEFCWPSHSGGQDDDLTVTLFPVATFKPVPCDNANGQVALSRWLMPGGSVKLDNADISIDGVVQAYVKNGSLDCLSGADSEVAKIDGHYDCISNTLGINRNRIHSWHEGINPQTYFDQSADDYLDLWRPYHLEVRGICTFMPAAMITPGEVAWSVFNLTITIDGVVYWENGEFDWLQQAANKALIESYEGAYCLLEPRLPIGID
jgi:hypothetical protein